MKNFKEILIILGGPNSPLGVLSEISISRLNYAVAHYKKGNLVLCTGGWGDYFNVSKNSHASYAKQYLIEKGLREEFFLEAALSSNTVEDAVKIKPILSKLETINLTIITSDYHLERVKIIFSEILKTYKINYVGVKSNLKVAEFNAFVLHEKNAIETILQNGLYY